MGVRWLSSPKETGQYRRSADVRAVSHGDKVVLMNLLSEQLYSLDGVACRVWDLLDAPATRAGLTDTLAAEFDAPHDEILNDLDGLLADLVKDGLVREGPPGPAAWMANRAPPALAMPLGHELQGCYQRESQHAGHR